MNLKKNLALSSIVDVSIGNVGNGPLPVYKIAALYVLISARSLRISNLTIKLSASILL